MTIKIRGLNKSYGEKVIFKDLDLDLKKGEFNIIMGRSGIGKTSLLRIVLGLEDYDGQVDQVSSRSAVFQENRLLENRSIYENISFVSNRPKEEIDQDLKFLDLEGLANKKVADLSGGMKRRVAILRAISLDRDLYVLDEPFKDMDRETNLKAMTLVREKLRGKTVLMSSHNIEELEFFKAHLIRL